MADEAGEVRLGRTNSSYVLFVASERAEAARLEAETRQRALLERKRLANEAEMKRRAEEVERKRLADQAERKRLADEAEANRFALGFANCLHS